MQRANDLLQLHLKDVRDDTRDIMVEMREKFLTKNVVISRDILNINKGSVKALRNLCDRVNRLVVEVIYILTMQTNGHQASEKNMAFVEKQIVSQFSKSIDENSMLPFIVRITNKAVIFVQPEPHLRYCV